MTTDFKRTFVTISLFALATGCSDLDSEFNPDEGLADQASDLKTGAGTCEVLQRTTLNDFTRERYLEVYENSPLVELGSTFQDIRGLKGPDAEITVMEVDRLYQGTYCTDEYHHASGYYETTCHKYPADESFGVYDLMHHYLQKGGLFLGDRNLDDVIDHFGGSVYTHSEEHIIGGWSQAVPKKFAEGGFFTNSLRTRCIVKKSRIGDATLVNTQAYDVESDPAQPFLDTLEITDNGVFECDQGIPEGWACAEGFVPARPDNGLGGDNDNGTPSTPERDPNNPNENGGRTDLN